MRDDLEKLRLSDRAEAILRSDRHALRHAQRQAHEPAILLTLVPDQGSIIDFMDAYVAELAENLGLQYVRLVATGLWEVPRNYLSRTFLVLADLSDRDENVVTLLYQTFGSGRRILVSATCPDDIPADLSEVPAVFYDLPRGEWQSLLSEVHRWASPAERPAFPGLQAGRLEPQPGSG